MFRRINARTVEQKIVGLPRIRQNDLHRRIHYKTITLMKKSLLTILAELENSTDPRERMLGEDLRTKIRAELDEITTMIKLADLTDESNSL